MFFVSPQAGMLYNSQLLPLKMPIEIHGDSEVPIQEGTANAVMLMLARNNELQGAVSSVKQLEEKFNQKYHYPWVLLNEEPFTEEFKQ